MGRAEIGESIDHLPPEADDRPRHSAANDAYAWDVARQSLGQQALDRSVDSTAQDRFTDDEVADDGVAHEAREDPVEGAGDAARDRDLVDLTLAPIERYSEVPGGHINSVYRVEVAGHGVGYLKPESGEDADARPGEIPEDGQWRRELAAFSLDSALGLGVVPTTVERHEQIPGAENASLQMEAPGAARPYDAYAERDREAMAVFDYVAGNTDRHDLNYRTTADGRPAAIDNGLCFPQSDSDGLRSQFVVDVLGKPLDADLVDRVRQVDEGRLIERLSDYGIADSAIGGVLARLHEVQGGAITGEAWLGEIFDGSPQWHMIRDSVRSEDA